MTVLQQSLSEPARYGFQDAANVELTRFRGHPSRWEWRDGRFKRVAGVPGTASKLTQKSVRINGATVGEGLALARTLHRSPEDFLRDDIVPPGHLWVMGATADSFDSRYWGFLPDQQVIGRAYALW
jgi:conjugal transfer pilin signal peptidase TrbI